MAMAAVSSIDPAFWAVAVVAAYKGACLLVGLAFGAMGYRLFLAGIGGAAGDLKAAAGERALELKRAAPGTFFALFGATVIAATVLQGLDVELPSPARAALRGLPEHPPMVAQSAPGAAQAPAPVVAQSAPEVAQGAPRGAEATQ